MDSVKINEVSFNIGSKDEKLKIKLDNIMIVVGPNNSGKSLCLREIEQCCEEKESPKKIIDNLDIHIPKEREMKLDLVRKFKMFPHLPDLNYQINYYKFENDLLGIAFQIDETQTPDYYLDNTIKKLYTLRLDGRNRFNLVQHRSIHDLNTKATNHFGEIFVNHERRKEIRKLVKDALGLYMTIDPSQTSAMRIIMSKEIPPDISKDVPIQVLSQYCSNKEDILQFGDGLQCYVGLIATLTVLPNQIVLIDEPEAFLHPLLTRKLSQDLSRLIVKRNGSLIVATHSPDFLMGCLETTTKVSIVRMTFSNDKPVAMKLERDEIRRLMQEPLSRSTGVFKALFHKGALVTESDADRAFYDEINRRLTNTNRGDSDIVILNGNGMHSLYKIVKPLRQLGIPAIAIPDLDFLNLRKNEIINLLSACDCLDHNIVYSQIATVRELWKDSKNLVKPYMNIKEDGIYALRPTKRKIAEGLLKNLNNYGLFPVPVGELEGWLKDLGIQKKKTEWLIEIFESMGNDETQNKYVRPGKGDVWRFIDQICAWIKNFQPESRLNNP